MSRWQDPEQQAALAELSALGFSATQIAAAMGEKRSAVHRAMHRYGLFAESRPRKNAPKMESR